MASTGQQSQVGGGEGVVLVGGCHPVGGCNHQLGARDKRGTVHVVGIWQQCIRWTRQR
jgi:hypothetical protein